MKATLHFDLPEERQLFKDYQDGIKLKYFLQDFVQRANRKVDDDDYTANHLLKELNEGIFDEGIDLFN